MPETMPPRQLETFGEVCGMTLARAHARSADRIAIAAYLGRSDVFDRAIAAFAESYADQNESWSTRSMRVDCLYRNSRQLDPLGQAGA
ncbi:DUF2252 family protein [Streptomyces sp. NPDC029003]|uniref:DUF2252 family protein n=1 Tax=Streptomyces sp. NPDC029003 TaxID=3155125 RepID=UPI0033D80F69